MTLKKRWFKKRPNKRKKKVTVAEKLVSGYISGNGVFDFMKTVHWIGFDLALKNNAVVHYDGTRGKVIYSSSAGPSQTDLSVSLIFFQNEVIPLLKAYPNAAIALDWSRSETFMNTNRVATIHKTFIAGYLYHSILEMGSYPIYYSPAAVRKMLGLRPTCQKEDVWTQFFRVWPHDTQQLSLYNEHELDALILAWCLRECFPLSFSKSFLPSLIPQNTKADQHFQLFQQELVNTNFF